MDVTRNEAEESLAAISATRKRIRSAVANGGAHYYLIMWGIVWFLGFLGSHFLAERAATRVWIVLDIIGALGSWGFGMLTSRRVRNARVSTTSGRIGLFWLALFAYCALTVWIVKPLDGRQIAMLLTIFAMLGWIAMGFLLSYSLVKLALFITALAFASYYLLPSYFYLCMAFLGGGTLIGSGLYIRSRWRQS
jgi:hypothetical protein